MRMRYLLLIVVACGLMAGSVRAPAVEAASRSGREIRVAQTFDPARDLSPYSNLAVAGVWS
jgi:hypothetical protein